MGWRLSHSRTYAMYRMKHGWEALPWGIEMRGYLRETIGKYRGAIRQGTHQRRRGDSADFRPQHSIGFDRQHEILPYYDRNRLGNPT